VPNVLFVVGVLVKKLRCQMYSILTYVFFFLKQFLASSLTLVIHKPLRQLEGIRKSFKQFDMNYLPISLAYLD